MSRNRSLDGVLLVDKPAGITSAGVVREIKRRLDVAKVGHLGTLDPFATGLLPLALGEGSKVVPFLNQEEKAYDGVICLGRATNTLDATGETTETASVPPLDARLLESIATRFRGQIEQVPPMFSALKRAGVPLYKLARKGVEVALVARRVEIVSLSLAPAGPETIALSVRCSKGTYVRSLARDIARALETVGHLATLRRTAFGPFDVSRAAPLAALAVASLLPLLTPREALDPMPELFAGEELVADVRRGEQRGLARLSPPDPSTPAAKLIGPGGDLVAVVTAEQGQWRLARVLAAHLLTECKVRR
jgi:tRNA pseudouridine55 synthase